MTTEQQTAPRGCISLTLDKEIEADILRRWLAINAPEDLNLTPEQVFHDVNFLMFQLERYQKAYEGFRVCESCEQPAIIHACHAHAGD